VSFEVGDNVVVIALALLAALPGAVAAYYAYRANQRADLARAAALVVKEAATVAATKSTEAAATAAHTAVRIDGRMDELLELTRRAAQADERDANVAAGGTTADVPATNGPSTATGRGLYTRR
jgi:hypothetical protein